MRILTILKHSCRLSDLNQKLIQQTLMFESLNRLQTSLVQPCQLLPELAQVRHRLEQILTLLDLAKASPLEQAGYPERAREILITLGMEISRGHEMVEEAEDMLLVVEEDKPLGAGEDLMHRDHHLEIPETEIEEAPKINPDHPFDHPLETIPMLILQINDSQP